MAYPKGRKAEPGDRRIGNQFWKQRSKHGRDKILASPEILWEAACEYFEWCENNPLLEDTIQKIKINGVGEEIVHEQSPKMRVFCWSGLELFLGIGSLKRYKADESYKNFRNVISEIEQVMFTQKFSGAASGFFNANIISRELGLADKQENKVTLEQPLFGDDDK